MNVCTRKLCYDKLKRPSGGKQLESQKGNWLASTVEFSIYCFESNGEYYDAVIWASMKRLVTDALEDSFQPLFSWEPVLFPRGEMKPGGNTLRTAHFWWLGFLS